MTPTMSEYFEAWKNSRFVAGDKAKEKAFVAASRLQDIADILGGLDLVYDRSSRGSPRSTPPRRAQTKATSTSCARSPTACATRRRTASKFTAEDADTLGTEAQTQAEAIAGQVSQAAGQLDISSRGLAPCRALTPSPAAIAAARAAAAAGRLLGAAAARGRRRGRRRGACAAAVRRADRADPRRREAARPPRARRARYDGDAGRAAARAAPAADAGAAARGLRGARARRAATTTRRWPPRAARCAARCSRLDWP